MKKALRNRIRHRFVGDLGKGPEWGPRWTTRIRHVLLISVDGMHEVDLLNCAKGLSTVNDGDAVLSQPGGVGRSRGQLHWPPAHPRPSDSFPGLMSIVTGATRHRCYSTDDGNLL